MNIFESEDEKNSRAKAILQYLILEEVFDNIGTERHLKTMEDGYKKETVKVNTYEASAKNVLTK